VGWRSHPAQVAYIAQSKGMGSPKYAHHQADQSAIAIRTMRDASKGGKKRRVKYVVRGATIVVR
jgi:hypothetical protein